MKGKVPVAAAAPSFTLATAANLSAAAIERLHPLQQIAVRRLQTVGRIAAELRRARYSVWLDKERFGGESDVAAAAQGMALASAVVVCYSEAFARSSACQKAVELAVAAGKPLFFVNVGETATYTVTVSVPPGPTASPAALAAQAASGGAGAGSPDASTAAQAAGVLPVDERAWLVALMWQKSWADARTREAEAGPRGMPHLLELLGQWRRGGSATASGSSTGHPAATSAAGAAIGGAGAGSGHSELADAKASVSATTDASTAACSGNSSTTGTGTSSSDGMMIPRWRPLLTPLDLSARTSAVASAVEELHGLLARRIRVATVADKRLVEVACRVMARLAHDGRLQDPHACQHVGSSALAAMQMLPASATVAAAACTIVRLTVGASLSSFDLVPAALKAIQDHRDQTAVVESACSLLASVTHVIAYSNALLREGRLAAVLAACMPHYGTVLYVTAGGARIAAAVCDLLGGIATHHPALAGQLFAAGVKAQEVVASVLIRYARAAHATLADRDAAGAAAGAYSDAAIAVNSALRAVARIASTSDEGAAALANGGVLPALLSVEMRTLAGVQVEAMVPPLASESAPSAAGATESAGPAPAPARAVAQDASAMQRCQLLCTAVAAIARRHVHADKLLAHRAEQVIVAALQQHPGNDAVAAAACAALAAFSAAESTHALLDDAGAVAALITALSLKGRASSGPASLTGASTGSLSGYLEVAASACQALVQFARNAAVRRRSLLQSGRRGDVMGALAAAAKRARQAAGAGASASMMVAAAVCECVRLLVADADEAALVDLHRGAVVALVDCLASSDSSKRLSVAQSCCATLYDLCNGPAAADVRELLVQLRVDAFDGIIAALGSNVRNRDVALPASSLLAILSEAMVSQAGAVAATRALAPGRDSRNIGSSGSTDAGAALVSALTSHTEHEGIVAACCATLQNLGALADNAITGRGAAPALAAALQAHLDKLAVAQPACCAVSRLAAAADKDVLPPTWAAVRKALVRHGDDAAIAEAACIVVSRVAKLPQQLIPLGNSGAIADITRALRLHGSGTGSRSAHVLVAACKAMSILAVEADNQTILVNAGAAAAVADAFSASEQQHRLTEAICLYACELLSRLALKPVHATALMSEGAAAVLLGSLRHAGKVSVVAAAALKALCSLCSDVEAQDALVAAGAAQAIADAFREHMQVGSIVDAAMGALDLLAAQPKHRPRLAGHGVGVVPTVVRAVLGAPGAASGSAVAKKASEPLHLLEACRILGNLADSEDQAKAEAAVRKKAVTAVVAAMDGGATSRDVATAGCKALRQLCKHADNLAAVHEEGGIARVARALTESRFQDDAALVTEACGALTLMLSGCGGSDEGALMLTQLVDEEGQVATLAPLVVMQRHAANARVVAAACRVIFRLLHNDYAAGVLLAHGVRREAVRALHAHNGDEACSEAVCLVLSQLALPSAASQGGAEPDGADDAAASVAAAAAPSACVGSVAPAGEGLSEAPHLQLISDGVVPYVVRLLERHRASLAVVPAALSLLCNLAVTPDACALLVSKGAVAAARDAVTLLEHVPGAGAADGAGDAAAALVDASESTSLKPEDRGVARELLRRLGAESL